MFQLLLNIYFSFFSHVIYLAGLPWWRLPTMRETRVQSLGQEDLEEEMATHSSILAWRIPRTEDPGYSLQATVHGVAKSRTRLSNFTFYLAVFIV